MMLNSDYKDILQCLKNEKVEFVLVGAFAMAAHGYPRATGDIDILVRPTLSNAQKVYRALALFGAPVGNLKPEELADPNIVYQIGIAPCRIDILTGIDGLSFEEACQNSVMGRIDDIELPVLSVGDILKNKKATGRLKDLLDIELIKKHKP